MSIEKLILATTRDSYNRLMDFFSSLVVKIDYEAEKAESSASIQAYNRYKYAYEKIDHLADYEIDNQTYRDAGFSDHEIAEFALSPGKLFRVSREDQRAVPLLNTLRAERMSQYEEINPYYRVFCGLPRSDSEIIIVMNNDPGPAELPIHLVNPDDYPLTYNRIFIKRLIDRIIEANPALEYLKYIERPIAPYVVRELDNFAIIRTNTSYLDDQELEMFFKAYNQTRNYILQTMYLTLSDGDYDAYEYIVFHAILFGTFNRYQALQLERYSLGDYTKNEIYDILDSNKLSRLKEVDLSILKKVVKKLPELIAKRASREVFETLVDLVAEKVIVKRYWLTKEYATDPTGELNLNTSLGYEKSVDVVFREEKIIDTTGTPSTESEIIPYNEFINEDDTWGGVTEITDAFRRDEIREEMRLKILQTDFSKVQTKYITVTKIIEMVRQVHKLNDTMALLFQLDQERGRFMITDVTTFRGEVSASPLSIYAALCWATAKWNGNPSPATIVTDAFVMSDIMILRDRSEIQADADFLGEYVLEVGSGRRKTLRELLPSEDFSTWLIKFDVTDNVSIADIFENYEANYLLVQRIREKIAAEGDADKIKAWEYILYYNLIKLRIDNLFLGLPTYEAFIEQNSPDFYTYLKPKLDYPAKDPALLSLVTDLQSSFNDYLGLKSSGSAVLSSFDELKDNDARLRDLKLLMEEFASLYVELYKIDFSQTFSDIPYNSIKMAYEKEEEFHGDYRTEAFKLKEIIEMAVFVEYQEDLIFRDVIEETTETQNIFSDEIISLYQSQDDLTGNSFWGLFKMIDFREEEATQHYDDQIALTHQMIEVPLPPEAP